MVAGLELEVVVLVAVDVAGFAAGFSVGGVTMVVGVGVVEVAAAVTGFLTELDFDSGGNDSTADADDLEGIEGFGVSVVFFSEVETDGFAVFSDERACFPAATADGLTVDSGLSVPNPSGNFGRLPEGAVPRRATFRRAAT